jgi:hypothetical protein
MVYPICRQPLHGLQVRRRRQRIQVRTVERKRATQRRYVYSARRDPITHVAHQGDQHIAGSLEWIYVLTDWRPFGANWKGIKRTCGWRPSRAVVIPRRQLDEEAVRWLAQWHAMNRGKI